MYHVNEPDRVIIESCNLKSKWAISFEQYFTKTYNKANNSKTIKSLK